LSVAPKRPGVELRSGLSSIPKRSGRRALPCRGEAISPGAGGPKRRPAIEKVQNPRKAGSLERDQPTLPLNNPLKPRPEVET